MATTITVSRTSTLFTDNDGDGVMDPGDVIITRLRIANTGTEDATNLNVNDTLTGSTLVAGSVQITPIAFNDTLNPIMGNTPITFTKAQLLGNDQDYDGAEINLTITGTSNVTNGSLVDNGNGTYTFTPTLGFQNGNASFQYTVTDEQGLASVSTGTVTIPVGERVWYVDSGAAPGGNGSFANPFQSLASLNGVGGAGDVDDANDIIFVYNRGSAYTGGIELEQGQKLYGDGWEFQVNGLDIGAPGVTTNAEIEYTTFGVKLDSGNEVRGLDFDGKATGAQGIVDDGISVGSLIVSDVGFVSGSQGQVFDVDNGGTLNVTLDSVTSAGSSVANGGVIDITGVTTGSSFTVTGATSITGTHSQAGIDISGNTGGLTVNFQGNVTVNTGDQVGINITGNTGSANAVTFSGGSKAITTTTATAVNMSANTVAGTTVSFNNGGLVINSTTGDGLNVGATTINVGTGASANSITTTTGQLITATNSAVGSGNATFATLTSGTTVGNAIDIVDLDGNALNVTGNVTIAGSSSDAINIGSNSTTNFNFQGTTTVSGATQDGVELSGANGTVTFANLVVDSVGGDGLKIVGATNSVTVTDGAIGVANDAGGDALTISGTSSAAINIGADLEKDTGSSGGNLIEIQNRNGGTINITGELRAATDDANLDANSGIYIHDNSGGTINLTNAVKVLNTAANEAVQLTSNTGATINFTGGSLDIDTTSGTGFSATGGGTVSVQGTGNTINATSGTALGVSGTTISSGNLVFQRIDSGAGANVGISLVNTGSSGGLRVTGTGTAGSGGTITGKTGADGSTTSGIGIYLNNTFDVEIDRMNLTNFDNHGIFGQSVNGIQVTNSTIGGTIGTSSGSNDAAVAFGTTDPGGTNGLSGNSLFDNVNISGGIEHNFEVYQQSGTFNLTIRNSNIHDNSAALGGDGLLIETTGTAHGIIKVDNVIFDDNKSQAVQANALGSSHLELILNNNKVSASTQGNEGFVLQNGGNGDLTTAITNNVFGGAAGASTVGTSIFVGNVAGTTAAGAELNATISGNTITQTTTANRPLVAFFSGTTGTNAQPVSKVSITGNTVSTAVGSEGIFVSTPDPNVAPIIHASVTNNVVIMNNATALRGIAVQATQGVSGGLGAQLFAEVSGNDVQRPNGVGAGINDIRVRQANPGGGFGNPTIQLEPGAGGGTAASALATNNPASTTEVVGTVGLAPNNSTVLAPSSPTTPSLPLLVFIPDEPTEADSGGVDQSSGQGGEVKEPVIDGSGDPVPAPSGTVQPEEGTPSAPPAPVDDGILTQAELNMIVEAAIQRWANAGVSDEQLAAMRAVAVQVVDMTGASVGAARTGLIKIDMDGAGYGWFVDTTPGEDSEFQGSGSRLTATAGPAYRHIDLLTVVMHELGHQIGLEDSYLVSDASELMYGYVNPSERRLPQAGDSEGGVPGSITHEDYALGPITDITTLPAGKTVDIYFKSIIDLQNDQIILSLNNSTTVSGTNFPTPAPANEINALDSLTLGNTVYNDANLNGVFDAGEGVVGVALQLYADTNDSGGWDAGDALLASTTTGAGGTYSFANLAPGDYIVVVTAANFNNGQPLDDLLIVPGVAADPDDNVDNDNNGVAATGGAVASQTITLAYNTEPTAGTGNDTNNTLDFGFRANQPPVANDDSVSVAEDSGANDLTAQLLANDTDPENDTRTITSATQGTHGTTSVVAGVLTYTPNGNYNGTDTFTYTIDDGNGHQDIATVNVTVTAVNDPVTGTAPATANPNEDAVNFAVTGMSISDVDATLAPAGVYDVTLTSTNGTLTLTTITGLTFTAGSGTGDATMTFHGTLADINTALATAKYSPSANYHGSATITLQVTDTFGGIVATGTGAATNDSDVVNVTVNSVNDEPVGADNGAAPTEGLTYTFTAANFSTGFTDPNDTPANLFNGVRITTLPGAGAGVIKLNGVAISAGDVISKTQLDNNELTFDPAAGSGGTTPTFTFQVRDDGGTANGGVELDQSPNTFTFTIASPNAAPTLDLDADDSVAVGTGYTGAYTEGGAAAAISDTDVDITDADVGDDIVSATITITNPETGDKLNVGALPGTVTVDPSSTDTVVKLVAAPGTSAADFEAAIEAVTYSSTSDNPTDGGTNTSRSITVVVNDGTQNSNVATATIAVTDVNDAPSGTSSTITAIEDTFRLIEEVDLGFSDVDGTFASVKITAVTGGDLYFDADGTAGAGAPVLVTLFPATYSAADLAAGKVSFKAGPNANGAGLGSITFIVIDDDGTEDPSANTLTVDVTAVNDSPELTTGGPIAATEQTPVNILTGASVSDVDLDARNGGNGDYAGAVFSVNRNPTSNVEDDFELVAGTNFTIDGINLKTTGGQIFGHINADANGIISITFTSLEAVASSALVDEVIQQIRYMNTSNNPPASVTLAVGFTDGSPGGGQGSGATGLDVNLVTVNIAGVNDAPVNSLGGTIGTGEDAIDAWLSGMSISDPDADPANDDLVYTFTVANGVLEIRTDVVGGIIAADITGGANNSGTITVTATLNQINATLAASNGLTYSPNLNFNGDDTLTVTTNDQGHNGSDPGLTGDGTSEQDVDTRTISVSPQPDPAIAENDAVSTPENVIGTGNVFANNGSGADSDPEGDPFVVTEVNGSAASVGVEITLASGAKLTLNADGSYSYNPNGKFVTLTDGTSGAVNTSTIGDTFTYTVTGGDQATVTVTVNGVAGPGDHLEGDSGNNTITGTPQPDYFDLDQGGEDTVTGLASDDFFLFGAELSNGDSVDGGLGSDQIAIQGNYNLTLGSGVINIESLVPLPGNDTRFGDTANNFYDYILTTVDSNIAAGARLVVDANRLRAGEDLTFNASAETDGNVFIAGGLGVDTLTGGAQSDTFLFGENGQWGASDIVNGTSGANDQLALRGNYTITFGAGQLLNIDSIALVSAFDTRFGNLNGAGFDYSLTMNDGNVGSGLLVTIDGGALRIEETLNFNGSAETNGNYRVAGGAAADVITGGAGADILIGRGSADTLTGGAGNDFFRYDFVTDSNSAARDGIQDFTLGDIMDLSRIDANSTTAGDQAFSFIGNAAFSNTAGELRFENVAGPIWLVQGDTDGNGVSDFEVIVVVTDANPITSSDFIL